jgi:SPP1 gp7 family putative phage head morphogenesis protein
VGTVRQRGTNGVTEITRRNAAAITRTAVNSISNAARSQLFVANKNLFRFEVYTATLDSRTTRICSSLDGHRFPVGEGRFPPLHFNCRSIRVAILDNDLLGDRPMKAITQKQLLRRYADQAGISPTATRAGLPRGHKGAFDQFARGEVRKMTGFTPAEVNYQQWLTRQSTEFVDDVLGPTRSLLFRKGDLKLDRFVNRAGDELNLRELAQKNRSAFTAAGLDPEQFL